jgi:hypothetical protein
VSLDLGKAGHTFRGIKSKIVTADPQKQRDFRGEGTVAEKIKFILWDFLSEGFFKWAFEKIYYIFLLDFRHAFVLKQKWIENYPHKN